MYLSFVGIEKAFDYGIPMISVDLIKEFYKDATHQVINNGKLTEAFEVKNWRLARPRPLTSDLPRYTELNYAQTDKTG